VTRKKFKGVILDLDGVVTGTARVHGLAWESMFNDYLKEKADRDSTPFVPFDQERDYLEYVDGKPRMKGVESFLESRGIQLPFGDFRVNHKLYQGVQAKRDKNRRGFIQSQL
jgi:beta-phosphoglucomutase-like phosphatase (HAD superfamily)